MTFFNNLIDLLVEVLFSSFSIKFAHIAHELISKVKVFM